MLSCEGGRGCDKMSATAMGEPPHTEEIEAKQTAFLRRRLGSARLAALQHTATWKV